MSRAWESPFGSEHATASGLYATDAKRPAPFSDVAHNRIKELEDKIKFQANEINGLQQEVYKLRAEKSAAIINSDGEHFRMLTNLWYAIDPAVYNLLYPLDVAQSCALAAIRDLKKTAYKANKARAVLGDAPST